MYMFACFLFGTRKTGFSPACIDKTRRLKIHCPPLGAPPPTAAMARLFSQSVWISLGPRIPV